jgi:pSer/pThr/pTyr-binding forkhead associated (FHA) protein
MDIEKATFDASVRALLEGRTGLFKGEHAQIHLGQGLVIGRSRSCDVSVARAQECLRLSKDALEQHSSYRKISRKHFKVSLLSADVLEVEDLSTNGTLVNGYRIHRIQITSFTTDQKRVVVHFGDGEEIVITPADRRGAPPSERRTELRDFGQVYSPQVEDVEVTPVP